MITRLRRAFILGGVLSLALSSGAQAATISRLLPDTNLNESAGASRSNATFTQADPSQRMIGDFFATPVGSSPYIINSITVWSVGSVLGEAIGQEFDSVSLYAGVRSQADFGLLSTGTPNTTFEPSTSVVLNSNPNITHTQVQYANGEDYEGIGTPGVFYPIWRTRFSNLNWEVPAGSIIDFAVWGTSPNADQFSLYGFWFPHVSNAANGGVVAESADGAFLVFDFADLSNPGFRANPEALGLWDKGGDVNVLVNLTETPEPGYSVAMLASLGILAAVRRRRRLLNPIRLFKLASRRSLRCAVEILPSSIVTFNRTGNCSIRRPARRSEVMRKSTMVSSPFCLTKSMDRIARLAPNRSLCQRSIASNPRAVPARASSTASSLK